MCIRMARRTNSCCSSHPVMYDMDLKKQFPSPLMDLTEAGTVRAMWIRFCWTHSTSVPCFHMSLSAILRSQDGTCKDKCRTVNYQKFQCPRLSGFQLTEQEICGEGSNSNCDGVDGG